MSDTDDNQAPEGQENPGETEAEDVMIYELWSSRDEDEVDVAPAAGVAGTVGGLGAEARVVEVLDDSTSEENSDIGPASEEEENMRQQPEMMMGIDQLPVAGFHIMFLDLVRTMLHRLYHNDHIIVRPGSGHSMVPPRHQTPDETEVLMLSVPEGSGDGAVGCGEGAQAAEPEDQAPEPKDQAEAEAKESAATREKVQEEPAQEADVQEETTTYQYENSEEVAQNTESKNKKEEFNEKQEGSEEDLDPAESGPEKSSLEV